MLRREKWKFQTGTLHSNYLSRSGLCRVTNGITAVRRRPMYIRRHCLSKSAGVQSLPEDPPEYPPSHGNKLYSTRCSMESNRIWQESIKSLAATSSDVAQSELQRGDRIQYNPCDSLPPTQPAPLAIKLVWGGHSSSGLPSSPHLSPLTCTLHNATVTATPYS